MKASPKKKPSIAVRSKAGPETRPAASSNRTEKLALGELNGHIGYFVRRLQVAVFQDFMRTLAPMKVRPAQYSIMIIIAANPGRSQAAIGHTLNIERARLARMLHELERRNWVERRAANGDGRSYSLFLTSEGEKAFARMKSLAAQHEAQFGAQIGPAQRATLMTLLKGFGRT